MKKVLRISGYTNRQFVNCVRKRKVNGEESFSLFCYSNISVLLIFALLLVLPVHADNINLAPISASSNVWSVYSVYPGPNNVNAVLDYSNTFDEQPSILSESALGTTDTTREIDSVWIPISPGDQFVWSIYMMSGPSGGQHQTGNAAQVGWDYYGSNGRICGNFDLSSEYNTCAIGWNTPWTQVTYDLTIPTTVTADGTTGGYGAGQQVVPTGVILWLQLEYCNSGQVWFAGSTFYINPTS